MQKYLGAQRYKKALNQIKEDEQKKMQHSSDRSSKRNIDPLSKIARDELMQRRKYIAPYILDQAAVVITQLMTENNVPGVAQLYDVIISTNPDRLNDTMREYLGTKESST